MLTTCMYVLMVIPISLTIVRSAIIDRAIKNLFGEKNEQIINRRIPIPTNKYPESKADITESKSAINTKYLFSSNSKRVLFSVLGNF